MKFHKIQAGEIYIVLFIQDRRKTPTSIQLNHVVPRDTGVFTEEAVPAVNQTLEQVS